MIEWYPHYKNGGVVFVDVYSHKHHIRLAGYDNYWIDGNTVGMFNDPEHIEEFGHAASYTWTGDAFVRGPELPEDDVEILRGVWLPDEEYIELLRNV